VTSPPPTVVVLHDAGVLAAAVAARLVTRLVDAQAERGSASVVLTGGTIGIAALQAVRDSPARRAVDWRRVDVWWGDERWLPVGHPDRNDRQAREALLDGLDLDPARVHAFPAPDGGDTDGGDPDGGDPDRGDPDRGDPDGGAPDRGDPDGGDPDGGAAAYARELAAAAPPGGDVPAFDVLLLGMGPEGHVASIFPESSAAHDERTVLAVHGCPKPPPTRVTLGFAAITAAREVWVLVSGGAKAPMVALALSGVGRVQVPAAGARGHLQTLWLLDEDAASQLPRELRHR